jgi:hypothetical protein
MSHQDDELDKLLAPLRSKTPDQLQMSKWKMAVQSELDMDQPIIRTTKIRWMLQLMAAMFVGFIVGAILTQNLPKSSSNNLVAKNFIEDATFEHTHTNLD